MGAFGNAFGNTLGTPNYDKYLKEAKDYFASVSLIGASVSNKGLVNNEIKKAVNDGYFNKIAFWVDNNFGKRIGTEVKEPYIVFNFDDGRSADYATYQTFLSKGEGRGTSFISTKFIGMSGYLTSEQVREMFNNGWDFQCHTWSHARTTLMSGGDVSPELGLTGCTNEQIIEELENNNAGFLALGLPLPKHLAYPNYITDWNRVTPIVSKYRQTMRVGGSLPVTKNFLNSLSATSWRGMNAASFDSVDIETNKSYIDKAIKNKEICMFEGHSTSAPYFGQLLDYVYSKGLIPHTVSEMWDHINSVRNKLVNVAKNNYEALIYFDHGLQISKQGLIIFNDTLTNISVNVADYYKNKGYHVAFWEDNSYEAMSYLYPNLTPFYDNKLVFEVIPSNNRISINSPYDNPAIDCYLQNNHIVFLSGDSAPGGLSFNQDYYVKKIGTTQIQLTNTINGSAIDITSTGVNVRINTHNSHDIMTANVLEYQKTVKGLVTNIANQHTTTLQTLGVPMVDLWVNYLQYYAGNPNFNLSYCMLTGDIPIEMLTTTQINDFELQYNILTGGVSNLFGNRNLQFLRVYNNQLAEPISEDIGNAFQSLLELNLSTNILTGQIPRSIGLMTKLEGLYLQLNQLSGNVPVEIGSCSSLIRIRLYNNVLTGYESGSISINMTSCIEIRFDGNLMSSIEINKILADCASLETAHPAIVSKVLNLSGAGMGIPTGQGLIDKATLQSTGKWTVTTN